MITTKWGRVPQEFRELLREKLTEVPFDEIEGHVSPEGDSIRFPAPGGGQVVHGTVPGFAPGQTVRVRTVCHYRHEARRGVVVQTYVSELVSETGSLLLGGMHYEPVPGSGDDICYHCGVAISPGCREGYDCPQCGAS